jgi:molybdate transport system regulatory protein
MTLSARNVLAGKVTEVTKGQIVAKVKVDIGGQTVTSVISNEAVDDLALAVGDKVQAIIKSSEVIVAKGAAGIKISARNILAGTVTGVTQGQIVAKVKIDIGGQTVTSLISNEAVDDLALAVGAKVEAIAKSSEVIIAK